MNEGQENEVPKSDKKEDEERTPGYCSATCVTKECMNAEAEKPLLKTSDLYLTCNLPKRFEHPHWFNGYGCQLQKQHPFYRTSSSEYGWYPPGYHTMPTAYFPKSQEFSDKMAESGMYRNYSLNTAPDTSPF